MEKKIKRLYDILQDVNAEVEKNLNEGNIVPAIISLLSDETSTFQIYAPEHHEMDDAVCMIESLLSDASIDIDELCDEINSTAEAMYESGGLDFTSINSSLEDLGWNIVSISVPEPNWSDDCDMPTTCEAYGEVGAGEYTPDDGFVPLTIVKTSDIAELEELMTSLFDNNLCLEY